MIAGEVLFSVALVAVFVTLLTSALLLLLAASRAYTPWSIKNVPLDVRLLLL